MVDFFFLQNSTLQHASQHTKAKIREKNSRFSIFIFTTHVDFPRRHVCSNFVGFISKCRLTRQLALHFWFNKISYPVMRGLIILDYIFTRKVAKKFTNFCKYLTTAKYHVILFGSGLLHHMIDLKFSMVAIV